jgi:hypothetical protein
MTAVETSCAPPLLTDVLDAAALALESFDAAIVEPRDCAALVAKLARVERLCRVRKTQAAVRASAATPGRAGPDGSADAAQWLALQSGQTVGGARSEIETVEALEDCPATKRAVESGDVSLAQAKEIASANRANPGSEGGLLEVARNSPMSTLRDEARRKRHEGVDAEELHQRQVAARTFRWWRNDIGNIAFAGEVPPEQGVGFVNRLDAETDRFFRAEPRDARESRDRYAADAFVKMIESGGGKGKANRADVVLVIDLRAWRRGRAGADEVCHVIGGGGVPLPVARELAADAFFKAVIHDGENILTVAHFGRKMSAELRTALDLGPAPAFEGLTCCEMECGRKHGLQWDHIDPVANDGRTSYANLTPRCGAHHLQKTERDRAAGLLRGRGRAEPP